MTPPPVKRLQSATERDMEGMAARKDREAAPKHPTPVGVPSFVEEDLTGQYEGEDLERARDGRPALSRFRHLEGRVDKLAIDVSEWRIEMSDEMGGVKAGMGELAGEVRGLAIVIKDAASRSHVTFTAKVDVDKAQDLDVIHAKKSKRDLYGKLVGAALSGGVIAKILQGLL